MNSAESILKRLSEGMMVADEVQSDAEVLEVCTGVTFDETTFIDVNESYSRKEFPLSEYEGKCRKKVDVPRRYSKAPGYYSKTVEFIQHGVSPEGCSDCSARGTYDCGTCDGTGRVNCPTCSGSAQVTCDNCTQGDVDCTRCDGTGSQTRKESEPCENCNGGGRVNCSRCENGNEECRYCYGDDPSCSECSGSGYVNCSNCGGSTQEDCSSCGGTGSVMKEVEYDCQGCGGDGKVPCTTCGGTNKVDCPDCTDGTERCTYRDCNGTGIVTCSRCKGDGEVVNAREGKLEFTKREKTNWETNGVPKSHLYKTDGTLEETKKPIDGNEVQARGSGTYRKRIKNYHISCTYVEYEYEEKRYGVTQVEVDDETELRYRTFPVDQEFVAETIREFSEPKEVADDLPSNVNILETEGHDGGDIKEPAKVSIRYEYEGETHELKYSKTDDDVEISCQTFPADQEFVADTIEEFSEMEKVADDLPSNVNILETEGHDGGDIKEPTKVNVRYEYKDEIHELRYSRDSNPQDRRLTYSGFPTDPSFLKRAIYKAEEEGEFRNESREVGVMEAVKGNASTVFEEGGWFGVGVIGFSILFVIVGIVFFIIWGILGFVVPITLPSVGGEIIAVSLMGLAMFVGYFWYSEGADSAENYSAEDDPSSDILVEGGRGLRFPLIGGIVVAGAALAFILTQNPPRWQVFLLIGLSAAVWCSRMTLMIKNWRISLVSRKKTIDGIMQESDVDREFIQKHGMEKYIPETDFLLSESSYRTLERFVFSLGFGGTVMWTGISLLLVLTGAEGTLFGLRGDTLFMSGFTVMAVFSTLAAAVVPIDRILTEESLFGYEHTTQKIDEVPDSSSETEESPKYNRVDGNVWYEE
jgi:hypothetical protein